MRKTSSVKRCLAKRDAALMSLDEFLQQTVEKRAETLKVAGYRDLTILDKRPVVVVTVGKKSMNLNRAYVLGMSLYGIREMCGRS